MISTQKHVKRWWYLALGVLGFNFKAYFVAFAQLDVEAASVSKVVVWLLVSLILFASSLLGIYTGISFKSGYVDRAVGTRAPATLFQGGTVVFSGQLRAVKPSLHDDAEETALAFLWPASAHGYARRKIF